VQHTHCLKERVPCSSRSRAGPDCLRSSRQEGDKHDAVMNPISKGRGGDKPLSSFLVKKITKLNSSGQTRGGRAVAWPFGEGVRGSV